MSAMYFKKTLYYTIGGATKTNHVHLLVLIVGMAQDHFFHARYQYDTKTLCIYH